MIGQGIASTSSEIWLFLFSLFEFLILRHYLWNFNEQQFFIYLNECALFSKEGKNQEVLIKACVFERFYRRQWFASTYACVVLRMCTCVCVCVHACLCTYAFTCICVQIMMCVWVRVCLLLGGFILRAMKPRLMKFSASKLHQESCSKQSCVPLSFVGLSHMRGKCVPAYCVFPSVFLIKSIHLKSF